MDLVKQLTTGDEVATARAISLVENNDATAPEIMRQVFRVRTKAHIIGVTGPSGVGKSCLVDRLIEAYRKQEKTVGVLAVDPTSPFTGGAILGDRIRMQKHSLDDGVFIRSMGSRGSLGGLSRATKAALDIISASGKDVVLVETVGIGQVEVDVVKCADTVLIVLVPELGDGVQALKAGVLEIGDIFVVNKADHEAADKTAAIVLESLTFSESRGWKPLVVKTVATTGRGIHELKQAISKHWDYLDSSPVRERKRLARAQEEVLDLLREGFSEYLSEEVISSASFKRLINQVVSRKIDPRSAAEKVFAGLLTG